VLFLLYFMTRVAVYVGVCMCIRTGKNTHALHMGYSDVGPGVWRRHPKNPDALNLGMYVCVYLYKLHIYMLRGGMGSWTTCFFPGTYFFFRKKKT